jgi:hypothetical protein
MVWYVFGVSALLFLFFASRESGWSVPFFAVALGSGLVGCDNTEWMKENHRQQALEEQREATPHVIREADGCKVYAFKTDREHYFTRCGSRVSTETNWSKSCGKSCTKQESDTIVTEGNK